MPLRTARRGDVVSYRNADGDTFNGSVTGDTRAHVGTPASSTATTGGTLAAATYSYRVTYRYGTLETAPGTAKTQVTTGATSTVTIDISALTIPAGVTSWRVYGRTGGSELLMGTVTLPTMTFVDDGSVTPAGALPTDSGAINIQTNMQPNLSGVAKASTIKSAPAYFIRY